MEQRADAKTVDYALLATPTTTSKGFKVVATFTLLMRPLRVTDCKLVISPKGNFVVWFLSPGIKVAEWAKHEIAETARQGYVDAQMRIAV